MSVDDKPVSPNTRSARTLRTTMRFDTSELAARAERDAAVSEWEDSELAAGTPQLGETPTVSRTSTVHDPLTTALLAEVSRLEVAEPVPVTIPSPEDDSQRRSANVRPRKP